MCVCVRVCVPPQSGKLGWGELLGTRCRCASPTAQNLRVSAHVVQSGARVPELSRVAVGDYYHVGLFAAW